MADSETDSHATHPRPAHFSLSEADYARFAELVGATSGLEIPAVRRADLERAIYEGMAGLGITAPQAYFARLGEPGSGKRLVETLAANLAVGETHFFRNQPQFEALEKTILPELIRQRQGPRCLRIWSAGCSTGEEPYSIAILLKRILPNLADWSIYILATDINRKALAACRRASYRAWSFRDVSPELLSAYFVSCESEYELKPEIRSMVTFRHLNLADDVYPSMSNNTTAMDLIICRNVIIYFNPETTRRVVGRFYRALRDSGWLVVGHSEPSQVLFSEFTVRNFPGTVVYQKAPVRGESKETNLVVSQLQPLDLMAAEGTAAACCGSPEFDTAPLGHIETRPAPVFGGKAEQAQIQPGLEGNEPELTPESLRQLKDLSEQRPADPLPPARIGRYYADRLDFETAGHWIELALQRDPLYARAHYLKGLVLQESGQLVESMQALRRCTFADPDFILGHYALAGVLARMEQVGRALKELGNVEHQLAAFKPDNLVPEGDGLTAAQLLELTRKYKELLEK